MEANDRFSHHGHNNMTRNLPLEVLFSYGSGKFISQTLEGLGNWDEW
jgi:hypothetical protein